MAMRPGGDVVSTTVTAPVTSRAPASATKRRRPIRPARVVLYVFLTVVALGWLAPLLLAVYASLRPYAETAKYGYFSLPHHLSLHYYSVAWSSGDMPKYFRNTLIIALPSVFLVLFFASFVAFSL